MSQLQSPDGHQGVKGLLRSRRSDAGTMAMNEPKLGTRTYDRILKVARTIADLAGAERLTSEYISEAIQ